MHSRMSFFSKKEISIAPTRTIKTVLYGFMLLPFVSIALADCGTNCEDQQPIPPIVITGSNDGNSCYANCSAPYSPPIYNGDLGTIVALPILVRVSAKQAKQAEDRFMSLCQGGSRETPEPATEWLTRANTVCLSAARGSSAEVQACRNFLTAHYDHVAVSGNTPVLYEVVIDSNGNEQVQVRRRVTLCINKAPLEG